MVVRPLAEEGGANGDGRPRAEPEAPSYPAQHCRLHLSQSPELRWGQVGSAQPLPPRTVAETVCKIVARGEGEAPNTAGGDNYPPPRLPDKGGPDGLGVGE